MIEAPALAAGIGAPLLRATLVWPESAAALIDRKLDIAVVRLPAVPRGLQGPLLVGSVENDEGPGKVEVFAAGFPKFGGDDNDCDAKNVEDTLPEDRPRELKEISGFAKRLAGARYSDIEIVMDGHERKRELEYNRERGVDWTGLPGAALFCRTHIVGIVVAQRSGSLFDFRAVRLDPLLRDPNFLKATAGGIELWTSGRAKRVANDDQPPGRARSPKLSSEEMRTLERFATKSLHRKDNDRWLPLPTIAYGADKSINSAVEN